ncbi:C2H2-type zinc finger transcription factor [Mucor lusitanicus]
MQTRSQTSRQKNEETNPAATQKAKQLPSHHLKTEPEPNAARCSKEENALVDTKVIKKEEETATSSVNCIFSSSRDADAIIKVEPTNVDYKQHVENKDVPDLLGDAYYYSCRSCNQTRSNLKSLLEHRQQVHMKSQRKDCPIKHVSLEPDIDDANYYCRTCEKRFLTRRHYKQHLNLTHHMVIIKSSSRQQSHHHQQHVRLKDAQQSINKFSHYCRPCQVFYCSQSSYDAHVLVAHNSTSSPSLQRNTTIAQQQQRATADTAQQHAAEENRYCFICNKTISKDYFRLHTTLLHTTREPFTKKSSVVLQPNVNDPDHYCLVCQQKFDSKSIYHGHLRDVHDMALQCLVTKDPAILPNPHNRCNYCRVCKKTMASRAVYRLHCKYSHFMVLEPVQVVGKSRCKSKFA